MYKENDIFKTPAEDAVLWRFMDFPKFLSILEKKSLFFPSLSTLRKEDPFEGQFTRETFSPEVLKQAGFSNVGKDKESLTKQIMTYGMSDEIFGKQIFINAWHVNPHESAAMWKLYVKSGDGIAIKSTFLKLRESFRGKKNVQIGNVEYVDYATAVIPLDNIFYPVLHKRISYEHEKELRAVVSEMTNEINSEFRTAEGIYIPIDVNVLIGEIYLAPAVPEWQMDLIERMVEKYGLEKNVKKSTLMDTSVL